MNLKTYTRENTLVGVKNSLPFISVCIKSGRIKLSARFVQDTGFTDNERVALSQDEDNPVYWYLHKSDENGFELQKCRTKKTFSALEIISKDLCRRLLEGTEYRGQNKTIKMLISTKPKMEAGLVLYEIITRTARLSVQ